MANLNFLPQTLIRTTPSSLRPSPISAATPRAIHFFSGHSKSRMHAKPTPEMEAKAVDRIEDLIYGVIVKRCKPDWLPLVPGASFWVPPRRSSYGVSDVVNKVANALTNEEYLSLVTVQGWPSSEFYLQDDAPFSEVETSNEDDDLIYL